MTNLTTVFEEADHDGLKWLDYAACSDMDLDDFFVAAGHTITPETLQVCRSCPVRRACVEHAYTRGIDAGYLGGMSPSQRAQMTMLEALDFIRRDTPRD
jgi:WhiB family transcriptional regulator, redox-sensing transcriptional regulator